MIWGILIHLGYNMWEEHDAPERTVSDKKLTTYLKHRNARPVLRCDQGLFREITENMSALGLNALVIDLGEGVKYESHPELAVRGSWTAKKLRAELARLRRMGIEPIPKLNFSTTHDEWMGPYSRCVSTDAYYGVCKDLIEEVCALFDRPRFFHLGMDEETAGHQSHNLYAVMRQHGLWWKDLYFLIENVQKQNVRPWVWSDYLWHHPEEFFQKMPRSVLQSNWYYLDVFRKTRRYVKAYLDLEEHGYDQVPCGSNHANDANFGLTVRYLKNRIAPERLAGFLQAPWRPTLPECARELQDAVKITAEAKRSNGF